MRILIVDDDALILQTLQGILETEGHRVTPSSGGREGIDAFRLAHAGPDPYGLVITDAAMPEVDGHRVVNAVKRDSPSTPVILFTGTSPQSLSRNESFKEDFVLMKPPNMRELLAAVRVAVVRSRAR